MHTISFKISLLGFNRKEVLTYIKQQSRITKQSEKFLSDEIELLKNERDEVINKNLSLENKVSDLEKALEYEKTNKIKLNNGSNVYYEYNQNSSQIIADTLIQAQKHANTIIERANKKSQQILSQLYKNCDILLDRLNIFRSNFGLISSDIFGISKEFEQILNFILNIGNEITEADINDTNEINEHINKELSEELNEIINENLNDESSVNLNEESNKNLNEKVIEENIKDDVIDSQNTYVTPLNDLPHRKKAVNISEILLKYSK